jgi:hypothetical protein
MALVAYPFRSFAEAFCQSADRERTSPTFGFRAKSRKDTLEKSGSLRIGSSSRSRIFGRVYRGYLFVREPRTLYKFRIRKGGV